MNYYCIRVMTIFLSKRKKKYIYIIFQRPWLYGINFLFFQISRVVSSWVLAPLAASITLVTISSAIVENFFCAALLAVSKGVWEVFRFPLHGGLYFIITNKLQPFTACNCWSLLFFHVIWYMIILAVKHVQCILI